MSDSIAILFSGGTDSTLAASMEQEKYQKIYLLSYFRKGLSNIENSSKHAKKLQDKYPEKEFIHNIFDVDNLFKELSYESYFYNLKKHHLFLLSTCGFCKLAMHVKTIQFCIDKEIKFVCDGANKNMSIYPFQRVEIIELIKQLYQEKGITYYNPVFEIPSVEDVSFYDKHLRSVGKKKGDSLVNSNSVGSMLHKTGIVPSSDIKGSNYDKLHQGKCLQLFLFRMFALSYHIPKYGMESYSTKTFELFRDKINYVRTKIIN